MSVLEKHQYLTPGNVLSSVKRFRAGYKVVDGCWLWQRSISNSGYAKFSVGKGSGLAKFVSGHRYSYELFYGRIPAGLTIDHLCRNRTCVNPKHLEAVTQRENKVRANVFLLIKTHCIHGHEFNEANTYIRPDGRPGRNCRACAANNQERARNAIAS